MPRDINLAVLSGTVSSAPTIVKMRSGKDKLTFTLDVVERYRTSDNIESSHVNQIQVEVLGRNITKYADTVKKNYRYVIQGYIRRDYLGDERDRTCVRCYSIEADD